MVTLAGPSGTRTPGCDDANLVARIQGGDLSAEESLVAGLRRRVFVILIGRVSDVEAARELTQDVLMAVVAAIRDRRVREPERLAAFVHGVAKNLANNHIRSRSESPVWVELTEDAAWLDAEEEMEMADRQRRLRAALNRLDPVDRRIVTLSVVEGRSSREVAGALGLSPDAVRARKSRALKRIGERLQKKLSRVTWPRPLAS